MITYCTSPGSFGEVFFFRKGVVFWLPVSRDSKSVSYNLMSNDEIVPNDKFKALSSNHLTEWSKE